MGKYAILATVSLMSNVFAFASLIYNVYQTHDTSSFNWTYLLGNVAAQILLVIYGFLNHAPEIYGPTLVLILGLAYIIYIKFIYVDVVHVYKKAKL